MPLDTTAAQSAQSLLNGIDYGALIGAPLEAAIKAQAMAARSTWEFIQEVGLNTDQSGQKSAVNVTFLYQKDGRLTRLVVPILTIVPIPLIIIDEVDIQFKANIHASASQATRNHESQDLTGSLSATGKVGWGPFSLSATFKASYSSKKDSTATQKSQYSVEYTQDVRVHASQAGMPAGLATVLNILSNSATEGSRDGTVMVSPRVGTVDAKDPEAKQSLTVTVLDANGLRCSGAKVEFDFPDWLKWGKAPLGKEDGSNSFDTDEDGTVSLLLWVPTEKAAKAEAQEVKVTVTFTGTDIRKETVFYLDVVNRTSTTNNTSNSNNTSNNNNPSK